MKNNSQVFVTGKYWLGGGSRAIGPALIEMIDGARQEVLIVAYRITVAVSDFNSAIQRALGRGCVVRIVVDRQTVDRTEDEFFMRLMKQFPQLEIWDFKDMRGHPQMKLSLHAKIVAIDRSLVMLGSANFSRNGMLENHEMSVTLHDDAAKSVCKAVDRLLESGSRDGVINLRARE